MLATEKHLTLYLSQTDYGHQAQTDVCLFISVPKLNPENDRMLGEMVTYATISHLCVICHRL